MTTLGIRNDRFIYSFVKLDKVRFCVGSMVCDILLSHDLGVDIVHTINGKCHKCTDILAL